MALIAQAGRVLTAHPPAMADTPLLTHSDFVFEPQGYAFVGMALSREVHGGEKAPFLNASCAA